MGKLKFAYLFIIATVVISACTSPQEEIIPKSDERTEEIGFVKIDIPEVYKSPEGTEYSADEVIDETFDVVITTEDGTEVEGQVHFIMPDDETLSYFAVSENIAEAADLNFESWVNGYGVNTGGRVEGCFFNCRRDYKKGQGLGTCKAKCWINIAAGVIVTIIAAAVVEGGN